MTTRNLLIVAAAVAAWSGSAFSGVTAEEAKQLGGPKLTEFGAERAGSADGSIPPYTGGISTVPKDFKPGSGRYPDPFKDEKPILTIDAKNMDQYADSLSKGTLELLKRFPDYRVNVYPTHRTMGYPDWVLKNTLKYATTAKLVGEIKGDGIDGVYGAIPFPIPKDGYEVMWNQNMRYQGPRNDLNYKSYLIDRTGRKTMVGHTETIFMWPYWDPKATKLSTYNYMANVTTFIAPSASVGQAFLQNFSINESVRGDSTWAYTPGQRRTRLAPELKYDTPAAQIGGALLFDEIGGFNGRMDRFDFKLVGKKEVIVPYNNYKGQQEEGLIGEKHENSEFVRWEKHRVWVVEATLKPGARHVYSRRTYYIDEDTWLMTNYDAYDQSGQLYRVAHMLFFVPYDSPRVGQPMEVAYDLPKGSWVVSGYLGEPGNFTKQYDALPDQSRYSEQTLSTFSVR